MIPGDDGKGGDSKPPGSERKRQHMNLIQERLGR
jgi:hypothetical protein